MKNLSVCLATMFLLSTLPAQAAGTHSAGDACTLGELGITEMSADKTGIIGCFRKTAGGSAYEWKSTGGTGTIGACYGVTGIFQYYVAGLTKNTSASFTDTTKSVSDVVTLAGYYFQSTGDRTAFKTDFGITPTASDSYAFGMICKDGYIATSCGGLSNGSGGSGDEAYINPQDTAYPAKNGCYTTQNYTGIVNAVVYAKMTITCCESN